jgi:hypothetical protein
VGAAVDAVESCPTVYPPTAAPVSATPTSTPAPKRARPRGDGVGETGAGGSHPGVEVGGGVPTNVGGELADDGANDGENGSPGTVAGRLATGGVTGCSTPPNLGSPGQNQVRIR